MAITLNYVNNQGFTYLISGTESNAQAINLLADYETFTPEDLVIDPPEVISSVLPPIPLELASDTYPVQTEPFNHLSLPRLNTIKSRLFILSVHKTNLIINGNNYGDNLTQGNVNKLITGSSVGNFTLTDIANSVVDFEQNEDIFVGAFVDYNLQTTTGLTSNIFRNYRILNFKYSRTEDRQGILSLEVGDELAYYEQQLKSTKTELYCGDPPTNRGEAANIMAVQYGLDTLSYPTGTPIYDATDATPSDSPYTYLQDLYAPLNQDVRTDNGYIVVRDRPSFNPTSFLEVTDADTLSLNLDTSIPQDIYNKVYVKNSFGVDQGIGAITESQTTIQEGDIDLPWFVEGARTETTVKVTTLGDTQIRAEETVRGSFPVLDEYPKDAINDPDFDWGSLSRNGVVYRKVQLIEYTNHPSGAFLVIRKRTFEEGKKLLPTGRSITQTVNNGSGLSTFERNDETYFIYDGKFSESVESFEHLAIDDPSVCEKDQLNLKIQVIKEDFQLNESNPKRVKKNIAVTLGSAFKIENEYEFKKISRERVNYSSEGINPITETEYLGEGLVWSKTVRKSVFDIATGAETKTLPYTVKEDPSPAEFIRATQKEFDLYVNVEIPEIPTNRPAPNIEGPFCYTKTEARTLGLRHLKDKYGLAYAKAIVVPYYYPVELGTSVQYNGLPYIVYSIEFNQETNEVSKSVLLYREV
jgi:hypothetical protein